MPYALLLLFYHIGFTYVVIKMNTFYTIPIYKNKSRRYKMIIGAGQKKDCERVFVSTFLFHILMVQEINGSNGVTKMTEKYDLLRLLCPKAFSFSFLRKRLMSSIFINHYVLKQCLLSDLFSDRYVPKQCFLS